MKIAVIGTGYVGLVTGTIFSDYGNDVYCLDVDEKKVHTLSLGEVPFYEPGLSEIVKRNVDKKRLTFTTKYADVIPQCNTIFVCVGTPSAKNGEADLTYLHAAVLELSKHLSQHTVIILKSTVPIGVEKSLTQLIKKTATNTFEFASCPEFLKEGSAVDDARNPDRIVIGITTDKARIILEELFEPFDAPRVITDLTSAQMIKYAANSFLATKISYANAIANVCERLGADASTVLEGIGLDPRIGKNFLNPGVGYGGSCFPKDVSSFKIIAREAGYKMGILEEVEKINKQQIDNYIEKVRKQLKTLKGKNLAILGLAFKPNTDDIREAPAIKIIKRLLDEGAIIKAYDPIAANTAKQVLGDSVIYTKDPYEAADGSHALLIVTEWNEFKELNLNKIKTLLKKPIIIDGRNIYDPKKVKDLGFTYQGIGR